MENFSKAIEQLGNDKIEVRLGGIYTLEQISRESDPEYWSVMEIITAFVREHARWQELSQTEWEALVMSYVTRSHSPKTTATDIAAVVSVIGRRSAKNRDREKEENWQFDLRRVDLRDANLREVHLEKAILMDAHLEGADLYGAHLEGAYLGRSHMVAVALQYAHLEGADLTVAQLQSATLMEANLEDAKLYGTNLTGAWLDYANLKGASLDGAQVEGAILEECRGLEQAQVDKLRGDGGTTLPPGLTRPADWPPTITWPLGLREQREQAERRRARDSAEEARGESE
jgi:Pentapeptide repeats (8 copies)